MSLDPQKKLRMLALIGNKQLSQRSPHEGEDSARQRTGSPPQPYKKPAPKPLAAETNCHQSNDKGNN
tara:strand:- start:150 stop:350 length:201 start_codon:yes stop_codon:yes gene_type:complete